MKYLKSLHGLLRMMETPAINLLLAGVEKRPEATLGELLMFMQAFNLRFGPATTPRQREVYDMLYPKLVKLRAEVAPALASAPAPTAGPDDAAAGEVFSGMSTQDLTRSRPPPAARPRAVRRGSRGHATVKPRPGGRLATGPGRTIRGAARTAFITRHLSSGVEAMSDTSTPHFRWWKVDDVAVVEILTRQISGPEMATELGEQLSSLLQSGQTRLLLNFGRTQMMTSTAFGTLLMLWKQVVAAHGQLRICSMDPYVRIGADIIRLGEYVPIHDDESSALAAFAGKQQTV